MLKDNLRIIIPNNHQGDISANFLAKILGQAKVELNYSHPIDSFDSGKNELNYLQLLELGVRELVIL